MIRGLLAGIDTGFEIDETIRRLKAIQAILECVHGDHKRTLSDVKGKLENLKETSAEVYCTLRRPHSRS